MVVAVEQTDAVGTNQGSAKLLAGIEDTLFKHRALFCLFSESGRDDDKGAYPLLCTEVIDIVGTELSSHHENGEIRLWNVLYVVYGLDALYFVFFGIHDM